MTIRLILQLCMSESTSLSLKELENCHIWVKEKQLNNNNKDHYI